MFTPFVLDVMVLSLLDEGRMLYSLCKICLLLLIIVVPFRNTTFPSGQIKMFVR